jgi:glycosyltransferase involved in cell wall biosynthesis
MQAVNPSSPVVPSHASSETLAIVIPCFNEAEALPQLAQRLPEVVDKLANRYAKVEVFFVDDGSTDATLAELRRRFASDPRFHVLVHEKNRGLGAALRTGFAASHSDVVVTTDADGTYEFGEILGMTALLSSDVDIVTASPYHPEGWRRRGSGVSIDPVAGCVAGVSGDARSTPTHLHGDVSGVPAACPRCGAV